MKIKLSKTPPVKDIAAYWNQYKTTGTSIGHEAEWIKLTATLDELSAYNNAILLMWSTATPDRFLYITDKANLTGYDASLFTAEGGVAFSFGNFHPDYLHLGYLFNEMAVNRVIDRKV